VPPRCTISYARRQAPFLGFPKRPNGRQYPDTTVGGMGTCALAGRAQPLLERAPRPCYAAGLSMRPFSDQFRSEFQRLVRVRRDVRRFQPTGLDSEVLRELLQAAHTAPSVGLSQPWRFVLVEAAASRDAVRAEFERRRAADDIELSKRRYGIRADGTDKR